MALTLNKQVPCHCEHCVPASSSYIGVREDASSRYSFPPIMIMKAQCNVVRVGDSGTDEKTGGGDGGGGVEDVTIFIRSDTNGQYQE